MTKQTTIKDVIDRLSSEWTYNAVLGHPLRKKLLTDQLRDTGIKFRTEDGFHFTAVSSRKNNYDLRIFTRNSKRLLQWRTCAEKGDRLVNRGFSKTVTERLSLEELFMGPSKVTEEDVIFFTAMYPELVDLLVGFGEALDKFDEMLAEGKTCE